MKVKLYNAANFDSLTEACADVLSRYRYRVDEAGYLVVGDVAFEVHGTTYSRPNDYALVALKSIPTDGARVNDTVDHFDEPIIITVPKAA